MSCRVDLLPHLPGGNGGRRGRRAAQSSFIFFLCFHVSKIGCIENINLIERKWIVCMVNIHQSGTEQRNVIKNCSTRFEGGTPRPNNKSERKPEEKKTIETTCFCCCCCSARLADDESGEWVLFDHSSG